MQLQPHTDLRPYFQIIQDVGDSIEWSTFFENDAPVELDIGCGRGLFLVNAALAHPERNFLGLEIDYREGRRTAKRLQKREMGNARVVGGDSRLVLERMIRPHSVSAAHVYFPDPWWKKRHQKRRLFTDTFVLLLARVVEFGGLVHSWTDVEDYFTVISGLMDHSPLFTKLPAPEQREAKHDLDYQTSFERKKRKAGLPIYRGLWQRVHENAGASGH